MKLTLFHFSDSHWISEWTDPKTHKKRLPSLEERDFYSRYIAEFNKLDLSGYYGGKNLLVHTGDFGNFYPSSTGPTAPIASQFRDIRRRHLRCLRDKFTGLSTEDMLAVPGNHDVNLRGAHKARFDDWAKTFKDWRTPFSKPPVVRVPIDDCPEKQVAIYLFNSAESVGVLKAGRKRLSAATVSPDFFVTPPASDYLRIAVLHHNSLPHYGQTEPPSRDDIFTNSGEFNRYLGEHNFKLVLSGHQHIGNEFIFAIPEQLSGATLARPTMESVFLSLAAPSFLRRELTTCVGFNVVEVEVSAASAFVTIKLTKFRYDREHHPVSLTSHSAPIIQFVVPRIDTVYHGDPTEQNRRIIVARKVVDRFYQKGSDITQIEEIVSPPLGGGHFATVAVALETCRQLKTNVAAVYSVAVLNPSFWWHAEPHFRRFWIEILLRARTRGKETSSLCFSFKFTSNVFDAIKACCANAALLSVASELRVAERGLPADGGFALDIDPQNKSSISCWQVEANRKSLKRGRNIVFSSTKRALANTLPEWDRRQPADILDVARIAIWPTAFFKSEDAHRVIQLHEDYLIPLFWLHPDRLLSRPDSKGRRKKRTHWGYDLIYARRTKETFVAGEVLMQRPLLYLNDETGKPPAHLACDEGGRGAPESYDGQLWGHDTAPMSYYRSRSYLSAEFAALLKRPDILFAKDAYAMYRAGLHRQVEEFFSQADDDCQRWLIE